MSRRLPGSRTYALAEGHRRMVQSFSIESPPRLPLLDCMQSDSGCPCGRKQACRTPKSKNQGDSQAGHDRLGAYGLLFAQFKAHGVRERARR